MKRKLLARRPSPAMVVALVALFSSLVGGAAAATLITGADIQNGTIATKDLKKNAVTTKKVKNGSLLAKDFKSGQLPAGATGPMGPAGAKGDACSPTIPECVGPKGDPGTNGTNGTNGATGPVGPTFGFWDYCCGSPDGTATVSSATITTPTAGRLWVTSIYETDFTCPANDCGLYFTLKVDGVVVPNGTTTASGEPSQTETETITAIGLTGVLPAGDHLLELRRGPNFGGPTNIDAGNAGSSDSIGAILLGG